MPKTHLDTVPKPTKHGGWPKTLVQIGFWLVAPFVVVVVLLILIFDNPGLFPQRSETTCNTDAFFYLCPNPFAGYSNPISALIGLLLDLILWIAFNPILFALYATGVLWFFLKKRKVS